MRNNNYFWEELVEVDCHERNNNRLTKRFDIDLCFNYITISLIQQVFVNDYINFPNLIFIRKIEITVRD